MPDTFPSISVFWDSNVLFSAAHHHKSDFHKFWHLYGVTPVTSPYSMDEVRRNLVGYEKQHRLEALLTQMAIVSDAPLTAVPHHIELIAKDRPILATAIFANIQYLVTGDSNHFGHLYETNIAGVTILPPRDFLARHDSRLKP